jgi:tRNA(Phe) wybutosine-synthesizing methylase Tyw3
MKPFLKDSVMRKSQLTPLETLRKQKTRLQKKSDGLTGAIEKKINYLKHNSISLLSASTLSSMAPFLRNLAAKFSEKKQKGNIKSSASRSLAIEIATGLANVIPLFFKGKKGIVISILLKTLLKMLNPKFTRPHQKAK